MNYELGKARKRRLGAMNHKRTRCELGKTRKRRREEGEEEATHTGSTTDRLSDLPEPIIFHILSFLDSKAVVQTSVLSRAWRSAWKSVPVLDLCNKCFWQYSRFQRFVDNVLSLRHPVKVQKMTYIPSATPEERCDSQFGRVVKYALCHNIEHLAIDMMERLGFYLDRRFSDLFGPISHCNLRTLELHFITLDSGFRSLDFGLMTTLKLDWCRLSVEHEEDLDPFSNFPCLQNLSLTNCPTRLPPRHMHEGSFKVCGLQLLCLKLAGVKFHKVKIVTPKLKMLHLSEHVERCSVFSELSLPSLVHADIRVYSASMFDEEHLISLFQCLHNARSLTLGSNTIQVLSGLDELLEQQPSPFIRLKLLNVQSSSIPYRVADYLLKGSCAEPNVEFV